MNHAHPLSSFRFGHAVRRLAVSGVAAYALLNASVASADDASQLDPGAPLPPIAVYARCYATITRNRLAPTQRYVSAVKAGTLNPIDACLKVMTDSAFANASPDPGEKNSVIQAFADFHRTWFKADDFDAAVPNAERFSLIWTVYNTGAPAEFLTRWAFNPAFPYSSIVTESSGLLETRTGGGPVPTFGFATNSPTGAMINYAPPIMQSGNISNIVRMADTPAYANFTVSGTASWPYPVQLFQSFGGGILGSQEFLALNYGRTLEDNDGGLKVPRRWSKAILNELLCRDIPAVSAADVMPFVDPTSPLPFRQSASCLSCHFTMDNMANTARNIRFTNLEAYFAPGGLEPMVAYPVDPASAAFAHTPPTGRLFFRSYDNSLVDVNLTDINSLGAALANTNDLYVCAASRYLEYFTGIHVNLSAPVAGQSLDQVDTMFRTMVINAGLNLKNHGTLLTLLKELLSNDFYKAASMRPSEKIQY